MLLDASALERRVLGPIARWAAARPEVRAVLLVGSYARGAAHDGSDVDVVLLADDPDLASHGGDLAAALGEVRRSAVERWGPITALRAHYADGLEVELCFGRPDWITATPLDAGTARVLRDGARVLVDRLGGLEAVVCGCRSVPP
jgi:predicted nucleotidyltransferase